MRKSLNYYVNSTISHPILNQIIITSNGLEYHDLKFTTDDIKPVQYIGAKAREQARLNKIAEIENQINKANQEILEINSKQNLLEDYIKLVKNKPSDKNLQFLKLELERLNQKLQEVITEKDQYQKEWNAFKIASPTHSVFETHSYNELYELYNNFKTYQTTKLNLEDKLKTLANDLNRYSEEYKDKTNEKDRLVERIDTDSILAKKLQQEIDELKNDEYYQNLLDEKAKILSEIQRTNDLNSQLYQNKGRLEADYKTKNDLYTSKQTKYKKDKEEAEIINAIINDLQASVDLFSDDTAKVSRITENILIDNNLKIMTKRVEFPKLPSTNEFTDQLKSYLQDLKYYTVKNINDDTEMVISDKMDMLTLEIESVGKSKERLYVAATNNLKTKIFVELKEIHDDVLEDLDLLKACMEANNPSLFKLYSTYEINSLHKNKLNLFNDDLEAQDHILEDISQKIFTSIDSTKSDDFEIEDIENIILNELDPKNWYNLEFQFENKNKPKEPLTTAALSSLSTGERARSYYIPMLSLIEIIHKRAKKDAPKVITMDEAFNSLDNEQTSHILTRIHDVCDLFIATIPSGRSINMVENTTRFETIKIHQHNIGGTIVTSCEANTEYEEFEDFEDDNFTEYS